MAIEAKWYNTCLYQNVVKPLYLISPYIWTILNFYIQNTSHLTNKRFLVKVFVFQKSMTFQFHSKIELFLVF